MTANLLACSRVVVAAYLLLVPLMLPVPAGLLPHDAARLAQVFVAAICALVMVGHWATAPAHSAVQRLSLMGWVWGAVAAAGLALSCFQAAQPIWALREVGLWLGMAFVALAVAVDRAGRPVTYWGAVAGTLLYNVASLLLPVLGMLLGVQPSSMDALDYNNVRFLNHVQTVALPLIAAGAVTMAQTPRARLVVNATLATGFALLFFTGGRATVVGLAAACVLAAALTGRAGFALLRRLLLAAVLGALLCGVLRSLPAVLDLPGWRESLLDRAGEIGSAERRMYLWRLAVDALAASPWWGIGPMHYAHRPNGEAAHPHNIYLQALAEWGLVTACVVLIAVLLALRSVVRRIRTPNNENDAQEGVGWLVGLVAILVDGGASGNFVMPVSQLWIAVCAGWSLQWWGSGEPGARAAACIRGAPRWVAMVAAALVLWLAVDTALQAPTLGGLNEASRSLSPGRLNPRYWSSGWF